MFEAIVRTITMWLTRLGLTPETAAKTAGISDFLMVLLISVIIYYITKFFIVRILTRIAVKTSSNWDDALLEHKVFQRMAFLIPGILITSRFR